MGGTLSCHRSIPRDPADLGVRTRKFSAACNFSSVLVLQERLNINTATEEELMTLPGVSRAVAHSIVEHRERIGGFRKVEDLALVSGVGATKLEAIKLEICVSASPLCAQQEPQPCTGININTASAPQLLSVRPLTDQLVRSIVAYRTQHGAFRSIEDLVRVRHINSSLLDRIRPQLYVERCSASSAPNGTGKIPSSPTSFSLSTEDMHLPPGGPTHISSIRPDVEPPLGLRDRKPVVRLGSWSLQGCSCDKANNPGVREVVSMTLLENQ